MSVSNFLLINGTFVFLAGQLYGVAYGRSISNAKPAQTIEAWRMAHSSICAGGASVIGFAVVVKVFSIPAFLEWPFAVTLLISAYCFALGTLLAAVCGKRGLSRKEGGISRMIFILYSVASVTSLLSTILLVSGMLLPRGIYS